MDQPVTAAFLSGLPLLRHAPPESLERVRAACSRVQLPAGDYLFHAEERAMHLHVVLSGRLEVVAADGQVLRAIGPGDMLGELSVLTSSPRSASVRARRDSELVAIDGPRFESLVRGDPSLNFALTRQLARELQQSARLRAPTSASAVFAIVPADQASSMSAFWHGLLEAFAELGSVTGLASPEQGEYQSMGEALTRLEATHDRVLLLVDGSQEWRSFAMRQADRVVLAVHAGSPPRHDKQFRGCELVFCDPLPLPAMAAWLDAVGPRAHHLIDRSDARASLRRAARRMAGRALGVTLSGGGARGGAHIGVLEALRESGLEPDRFGGCSIGSFVSGMAARDWTTERMTDVWKEEFVRRSPFSDYAVPRASLLRGRRAERMLQRVFGDLSFEELARPAFAVSADLVSSELVVHQRGLVWEAVAASMAIPGLVPPRRHDGRLLVDGGILDNLPVDVMLEAGEGPVIAIDVMRKPGIPDARAAVDEAPNIVETLARATVLGSADRAARNRELATLTITPDVQDIALRDFARVEHATEAGRSAAAAALERGGKELVRQALEC